MSASSNLMNHLLIAMPNLADPNFSQTVTYICDHNDQGAMGLVINRPLDVGVTELLQHMQIKTTNTDLVSTPVYQGGPVQVEQGFVIHENTGDWDATISVTDDVAVTLSQDILEAIAIDKGPKKFLITLGYAGWGAGQLEQELAANAWLNGPCNTDILFEKPAEQRWSAAAALLGVELNLLSTDVGHA